MAQTYNVFQAWVAHRVNTSANQTALGQWVPS